MRLAHKEDGFHVVELIITVVVLIAIGLIGFKVFSIQKADKSGQGNKRASSESTGSPVWAYDQQKREWFVKNGTAPNCPSLLLSRSPVDMQKVVAVGLPGAYRGYSYKAHGGFRVAPETTGKIDVVLPMDARLMGITRYYEAIPGYPDELQYLVDFENDCGVAFRFDHLQALSPELQKYAEKTPEPKKDDTRRDAQEPLNVPMKAGDLVATAVGFPAAQNYGFDFGVYDYRERNEISKNSEWAKIHEPFSAQTFHGVCWLPLLPSADAQRAETMAKDRNNYNSSKPFYLISDYCNFAPYNTLDFNNGQPTDG